MGIKLEKKSDILIKLIKERRSCRFFDPDAKVKKEDIKITLDAAKWAPSARNLQPLEYVMITDKKSREQLSKLCRQDHPNQAPLNIAVLGDLKRAKDVGDISPHDTTTHIKGLKMFIYMDAAAAIQNMLLTAENLGYSSLWIASFDEDEMDVLLGIPDRFIPISVICIGKKSKDIHIPPRRDLAQRIHYEKWGPLQQFDSHLGFSKRINELF